MYTNWQANRRNRILAARVIAALKADVDRVRDISAHNAKSADPVDSNRDRPRAFVHFPTQSYELLLFGGQIASLSSPETLDVVLAYLQQAEHVNAMLHLFEEIEVQTAGLPGAPLTRP